LRRLTAILLLYWKQNRMFSHKFAKDSGIRPENSRFPGGVALACAPWEVRVGCDAMTRRRWLLIFAALILAVAAGWLWWVKPRSVDMAAYAPADSLLYLEANRPFEVVETVAGTDAWKAFDNAMGGAPTKAGSHWLQSFVRWTGIGPVESVILSRAQVAVVVTDLGTTESGDTLKVTTEAAILIETHTAEARVKQPFEDALKTLAQKTYAQPTPRRVTVNGVEFVEWIASDSSRQIVGTLSGSLAIIGTSERVVQDCLAVSHGQRPALKDDPELKRLRQQLAADRALSFGYVPSGSSARLLAVGIPMLLGRAPDSDFQRLITTGAAKIFGSLGWTSRPYLTGIEDRYLITLEPDALAHLKPSFRPPGVASKIESALPADAYSATAYRFADPSAAWLSLKTAVSSQVDALSAAIFSALLKSSLLSYGIDEPETFLGAVEGELLTLRLDENVEHSILVARVRSRSVLRDMLTRQMSLRPGSTGGNSAEMFEDSTGDLAASLSEAFIVIGTPPEVRNYVEAVGTNAAGLNPKKLQHIRFFAGSSSANVVTYTNDEGRVHSFFNTLIAARGKSAQASLLDNAFATLPYSVTETTLDSNGLDRTTRSPLGQFSSLLPLLIPDQVGTGKAAPPSRQ
jgi:hypothetical protein